MEGSSIQREAAIGLGQEIENDKCELRSKGCSGEAIWGGRRQMGNGTDKSLMHITAL